MKRIFAIVIAALMLVSLSSCSLFVSNRVLETIPGRETIDKEGAVDAPGGKTIYIDREKSSFSDAQRAEGEVIYICQIAVCNDTDEEKSINFIGDFEQEYDAGIITEIYLEGRTELQDPMFFVPANSTEYYTVCFWGEICGGYEGETLKMDRSLPAIELREVELEEQ